MTDIAARLDEARMLVARALQLVVDIDETLAAAELEQALATIVQRAGEARFNSSPEPRRPTAIQ